MKSVFKKKNSPWRAIAKPWFVLVEKMHVSIRLFTIAKAAMVQRHILCGARWTTAHHTQICWVLVLLDWGSLSHTTSTLVIPYSEERSEPLWSIFSLFTCFFLYSRGEDSIEWALFFSLESRSGFVMTCTCIDSLL